MSAPTVVSMRITNVPVFKGGVMSLVDCDVTVDFAEIAANNAEKVAFLESKKMTGMYGAVVVKAVEVRRAK